MRHVRPRLPAIRSSITESSSAGSSDRLELERSHRRLGGRLVMSARIVYGQQRGGIWTAQWSRSAPTAFRAGFGEEMGQDGSVSGSSFTDANWLTGFETFVERMRPAFQRFFVRRFKSPELAEELVQELFIRLLRKPNLMRLENLDGYAFRAAVNLARDQARSEAADKRAGATSEFIDLSSDEPPADRVIDSRRRLALITEAINALPERTRTIIILNRFENMSYSQIAEHIGISQSAIEKHMTRALTALRSVARDDR